MEAVVPMAPTRALLVVQALRVEATTASRRVTLNPTMLAVFDREQVHTNKCRGLYPCTKRTNSRYSPIGEVRYYLSLGRYLGDIELTA